MHDVIGDCECMSVGLGLPGTAVPRHLDIQPRVSSDAILFGDTNTVMNSWVPATRCHAVMYEFNCTYAGSRLPGLACALQHRSVI